MFKVSESVKVENNCSFKDFSENYQNLVFGILGDAIGENDVG